MISATLCFVFRDGPPPAILLGYKKRGFGVGKYDGFGGKRLAGENPPQAASRELEEESSLIVLPSDLVSMGIITFMFPYKPVWDQIVFLYIARSWYGIPTESEEMRPEWFAVDNIPFHLMWHDAQFWMPHLLLNHSIDATFILNQDNETVKDYSIRLL
jgi:8-oxo-dGTP diphosphatase